MQIVIQHHSKKVKHSVKKKKLAKTLFRILKIVNLVLETGSGNKPNAALIPTNLFLINKMAPQLIKTHKHKARKKPA